jgi:uncharacterized membrane protein YoaK (UPF0700 family)
MAGASEAVPAPRGRARARRGARGTPASVVRDRLLAGLTFSSGAVDALAFLGLGKVFTAFQTGNLVFLGIGLADASAAHMARAAVSLAAFGAGVLVATHLVRVGRGSGLWPPRVSAALGLAWIAQAVLAVVWLATSGHPGTESEDVLLALSAVAMGLQSGAVLSLGVTGVFTTAVTATVMFLMRDEADRPAASNGEQARFVRVLVALVAGATAGAALVLHARAWAPLLPLAATAGVLAAATSAWPPAARLRPRRRGAARV